MMYEKRNISAIIMAVGFSRRMGENKLLLRFRGRSLIAHTLALATALPFYEVILVGSALTIENLYSRGEIPDTGTVRVNHTPEQGQSASLRLGIEAARGDAFLFLTGDQPLLEKGLLECLLAKQARAYRHPANHPRAQLSCFILRQLQRGTHEDHGGHGGRAVWEQHPERCLHVEVSNPAQLMDIDTPEQYRRLLAYDADGEDF